MATVLVRGRPAALTGVAVVAGVAFVLCVVGASELVLGTVVLTTAFFTVTTFIMVDTSNIDL